jgi:hypothetical protein
MEHYTLNLTEAQIKTLANLVRAKKEVEHRLWQFGEQNDYEMWKSVAEAIDNAAIQDASENRHSA